MKFFKKIRFSYVAIIAGMKILNEIEQNERAFVEDDFNLSSESESESDDEMSCNIKKHQKVCKRQNNIMPNSRLSETLEDINCNLMRRIDSNASNHQPSPKTTHRLLLLSNSQLSVEDLNNHSRPSS